MVILIPVTLDCFVSTVLMDTLRVMEKTDWIYNIFSGGTLSDSALLTLLEVQ